MSISRTSGSCSATRAERALAVLRLADDVEVGLRREEHAHAPAHEVLVVDDAHGDGHPRRPRQRQHGVHEEAALTASAPPSGRRRRARSARACR